MQVGNQHQDETVLLRQLQQGSRDAFEQLYRRYAQRLTARLLQLVRSEDVAADLLQDIFLKIWQMREEVDPERSFGALLYTMAANLSSNAYRAAVREQQRLAEMGKREAYTHIEEAIDYAETSQLLDEALGTLTDRQREVYVLHRLEGKSYKEISESLQISHSAINQHLQLANKQIRAFMQSRLPEVLLFLLPMLDGY